MSNDEAPVAEDPVTDATLDDEPRTTLVSSCGHRRILRSMQTFPIAAAGLRSLWVLLPAMLVMAAVSAVLLLSVLGSRSARFELNDEGLRLRGDEARTVYIPTRAGYSVLLSPKDPDAFLAALRSRAQ